MNRTRLATRVSSCMLAVLLLASCGTPAATPAPTPTPTPKPRTAQEVLTAMQDALKAAGSYHFNLFGTMTMDAPSQGMQFDIPLTFSGDVQEPDRMQGSMKLTLLGTTIETGVIVIGGQAWAKDPTTGQWVLSAQSQEPVSPTQFTDLSESALAGMTLVGEETLGGQQVVHVAGKTDQAMSLAAELGATQLSLETNYWIAKESDLPLKLMLSGSVPITQTMEGTLGISLTMEFSAFGEPVTIEPPPAATATP